MFEGNAEVTSDNQAAVVSTGEQTPQGQSAVPESGAQTLEGQSAASVLSLDERLDQLFAGQTGQEQMQTTPPPAVDVPAASPSQEELLAGTRFKAVDELVKGYQNLQSEHTKKSMTLAEIQKTAETLKTENALLMAKLFESGQQPAGQQQQQPAGEQTVDGMEALDNEKFMEKFYDNPMEMVSKIVQRTIKESLSPLESRLNPVIERDAAAQNQQSWNNATKEFLKVNPDMMDFKDEMNQYLTERGLHDSKAPESVLKDAYIHAKGLRYQPPQVVDPKTYLQDPKFVDENILKNQDIVNQVLKAHMQQVRQISVPPSITGTSSGPSLSTPPERAKTLEEAHGMFESLLSNRFSK